MSEFLVMVEYRMDRDHGLQGIRLSPFTGNSKTGERNMEQTVYNPQKGRLETINIDFTDKNTTWFDEAEENKEVYMITDFEGCLVITDCGYTSPVLIYDISRSDINHDKEKAEEIKLRYTT